MKYSNNNVYQNNKLYKMDKMWVHQPWYDANSVFKLIKITDIRLANFGVDCIWENIETRVHVNHWDRTMCELNKEEMREFNLNILLQNKFHKIN